MVLEVAYLGDRNDHCDSIQRVVVFRQVRSLRDHRFALASLCSQNYRLSLFDGDYSLMLVQFFALQLFLSYQVPC